LNKLLTALLAGLALIAAAPHARAEKAWDCSLAHGHKVTFNKTTVTLEVGKKVNLNAGVKGNEFKHAGINVLIKNGLRWYSSNPSVAVVTEKGGVVTAVSPGTATIRVESTFAGAPRGCGGANTEQCLMCRHCCTQSQNCGGGGQKGSGGEEGQGSKGSGKAGGGKEGGLAGCAALGFYV